MPLPSQAAVILLFHFLGIALAMRVRYPLNLASNIKVATLDRMVRLCKEPIKKVSKLESSHKMQCGVLGFCPLHFCVKMLAMFNCHSPTQPQLELE